MVLSVRILTAKVVLKNYGSNALSMNGKVIPINLWFWGVQWWIISFWRSESWQETTYFWCMCQNYIGKCVQRTWAARTNLMWWKAVSLLEMINKLSRCLQVLVVCHLKDIITYHRINTSGSNIILWSEYFSQGICDTSSGLLCFIHVCSELYWVVANSLGKPLDCSRIDDICGLRLYTLCRSWNAHLSIEYWMSMNP